MFEQELVSEDLNLLTLITMKNKGSSYWLSARLQHYTIHSRCRCKNTQEVQDL